MRVSGLFACCLARGADGRSVEQCGAQTAASRPTNAEKEGKKYAPKKYVSSKETKEERKNMYYKYKKVCIKSLAVRAGSVRPRGLAGSIKKVCT